MDCWNCVKYYYESDTNRAECRDPEYEDGWEENCPHYYNIEDAKADAKLRFAEKG